MPETWSYSLFGLVRVSDSLSTFSVIRMDVNTKEKMFMLSQGVYLDYLWTLFFRKKCSMIWSLVKSVSLKDLTKPPVSFSFLSGKQRTKPPFFSVVYWNPHILYKSFWISGTVLNLLYLFPTSIIPITNFIVPIRRLNPICSDLRRLGGSYITMWKDTFKGAL